MVGRGLKGSRQAEANDWAGEPEQDSVLRYTFSGEDRGRVSCYKMVRECSGLAKSNIFQAMPSLEQVVVVVVELGQGRGGEERGDGGVSLGIGATGGL